METPIVVDLAALEDKLMRLKVHSTQSFHRPRIRKMLQDAVTAAYERGVAEGIALYKAGFHPEGLPEVAATPQLPAPSAHTAPAQAARTAEPEPARPEPQTARAVEPEATRPQPQAASQPKQVVEDTKQVPYRLRRRKLATA